MERAVAKGLIFKPRETYEKILDEFLAPIVRFYQEENFEVKVEKLDKDRLSRLLCGHIFETKLVENLAKGIKATYEESCLGKIVAEANFGIFKNDYTEDVYIYGGQMIPGWAATSVNENPMILFSDLLNKMINVNNKVVNYLKPYVEECKAFAEKIREKYDWNSFETYGCWKTDRCLKKILL